MADTDPTDVADGDTTPEAPAEVVETATSEAPAATVQRDADAEVKKAYEKLRTAEKQAAKLAAELKRIEDQQLTEHEKIAREADEAKTKLAAAEDRIRKANLLASLSRPDLGIVNAQAAAKLIEGVEFSEDGEPVNLDDILPGFLEDNAFLVAPQAPQRPKPPVVNAGDGTGAEPPAGLTAEEIAFARAAGMTPERYAAMKNVQTLDDYKKVAARQ